ncbi:SDR family NAD(P)-dependent oxidoreductase [Ralstonia soli]|uniref:Glucose 1-dehydrogenase n=1 Tax=Ralstonia soli TaxID=2953896 RepID=A0ABT1AED0_9RALS|nr:glucose 1-dehydrogenase [Ralstonia soli]MCO5396740.1 glucose 1-dehydrogenase [Ralstonia soli]
MRVVDIDGNKILEGKVAIITGGGRGMGKEIALTFSKAGANVAVCDISLENLTAVEEEIKLGGGKCLSIAANISNKDQVEEMMAKVYAHFGKIDILINNAGICISSSLLETSVEEWDANMNVNLKGAFLCLQAAAKYMVQQMYGKIVNISSICGRGAVSEGIAYSASKAGVIQVTCNAAAELGKYNINVNSIAPGFVATPLVREGKTPEEYAAMIKEFSKPTVLGKTGLPKDIANAALFLVSDESAYISGQTIPVDGGRTNRM